MAPWKPSLRVLWSAVVLVGWLGWPAPLQASSELCAEPPAAWPSETIEQAVDLGNGTAQNVLFTTEDESCLRGEPYVIAASRDAYAAAAWTLVSNLPAPSTGSIPERIIAAAQRNGVPVAWALRVARCESGYNPFAIGPLTRTGRPKGVFQFMDATFARTPQGRAGLSVFDPDANIAAAMWLYRQEGPRPWECK